jgi:hypothetical protein
MMPYRKSDQSFALEVLALAAGMMGRQPERTKSRRKTAKLNNPTKTPYNFKRAKIRRKMAKQSRKINRRR